MENHYEGNIQVRSKKVQLYMYEYELFKMKPHETFTEMTNRLNALVTTLRKLGKPFTKEEVNNKILRILPKNDWNSRFTSIKELKILLLFLLTCLLESFSHMSFQLSKEVKNKLRKKKRKRQ